MDVSVSLARDSYHAFFLAMRALHVYPAKILSQQPIAPVLSFLAPAALLRASSTLRPGAGQRPAVLKSAQCRNYSSIPQYYPIPPPAVATETEIEGGGKPLGAQTTDIPQPDNVIRKEKRLRFRRSYARRYTGTKDGTDEELRDSGIFTLGKAISAHQMTVHLLSEGRSVKDIKKAWDKLDHWTQDFKLEDFMEWLVDTERFMIAARILEAVHKSFKPIQVGMSYSQIILGNLELLRIPDDIYWIRFRNRQSQRLYALFKRFLTKPDPEAPVVIAFINSQTSQFVAYHLARNLPPEDLPELYDFLNEHIDFRNLTLLHFIDRLAKEGDYLKGYEIIKVLVQKDPKITSDLCRKAFTLLLSKATQNSNQDVSGDLLQNIFEVGLSADTAVYNVLIYNAIRNGKTESALAIYRKMLEEGLRPNPITFAHMFHLHKRTGDVAAQRNVVEGALKAEEALCAHLCCDIVHASVLTAPQGRRFPTALETYQKLYLPGVPALLGIAPKTAKPHATRKLLVPNKDVTAVLVGAFVQDELDPARAWELYRRFVAFKDIPEYNSFFGTQPIISNIFLKSFGASVRTLDMALEVMNELLAPPSVRFKTKIGPNQFSWSILLKAFSAHGRMQQAEAILKVMKRQGFAVKEVTWVSLMRGYLTSDNPEEAGATLGRMLEESVGLTGRTLALIAKMENDIQFRAGLDRVAPAEKQEASIGGVFKPRPVRNYPPVPAAVAEMEGGTTTTGQWDATYIEAQERREFAARLARQRAEEEEEKARRAQEVEALAEASESASESSTEPASTPTPIPTPTPTPSPTPATLPKGGEETSIEPLDMPSRFDI
ncbi:hypothetical protein DFH27DRAFT_535745 [Peziza echinospora]|nr:hypothetical protein DFH27DRAFT_535745 [Peziza echinospora]